MTFFEQQEQARQRSRFLIALFGLAVLGVMVCANVIVWFAFRISNAPINQAKVYFGVTFGTALLILGESYMSWQSLREGGKAVARRLGARPLFDGLQDRDFEQRDQILRNVADEMAIASGVAAPEIFVMRRENAINALAAGYHASDAVLIVTQGAISQLTRDELQGIVAHEFSHILNGDMRLNSQLVSLLSGLMGITILGRTVVNFAQSGRRRGLSDRENPAAPFVIAGVLFIILGSVGVLFGRLIKAGISRQREFLADASAVQFTRNPEGLRNALAKARSIGTQIRHPAAEAFSHMFLAQAFKAKFFGWLSSHPPIDERIARVPTAATMKSIPPPMRPELLKSLGSLSYASFEKGVEIYAQIPEGLIMLARAPKTAECVAFGLLLEKDALEKEQQIKILRDELDSDLLAKVLEVSEFGLGDGKKQRFALLSTSVPALLKLDDEARARFLILIKRVIEANGKITLFEFSVFTLLRYKLEKKMKNPPREVSLIPDSFSEDASLLLSLICRCDSVDGDVASRAFDQGKPALEVSPSRPASYRSDWKYAQVFESLTRMRRALPQEKFRLMRALSLCVLADGVVTQSEGEVIRALGAALDCPVPVEVFSTSS